MHKSTSMSVLLVMLLCRVVMLEAQTCPGGLEEIPYNNGMKPQMLIGIGAPSSGFALLFDELASHPNIIPSNPKAVRFFDRPGLEVSMDSFGQYINHWGNEDMLKSFFEQDILMEFSPSYLSNPLAPCNIRRMFPDAKLVVSVRDPTYSLLASINEQRDSCLHKDKSEDPKCCSDHTPLKPWLQRDLEQLKAHYEQCLDPFAQDPWWGCPVDDARYQVSSILYGPQIARWMMIFPLSQFIFVNYEDLIEDADLQIQRIAAFAGMSTNWTRTHGAFLGPAATSTVNNFYVDANFFETLAYLKHELQEPLEDFYRIIESKGVILRHPNEDGFRENFVSTQDSLSFCCQLHHCDPDSVLASLPLSVMNEAVWHPSDSPPTDKIQLLSKLSNEIFFLQLALLIIGWIEAVCLLNRRNLRAHVLG